MGRKTGKPRTIPLIYHKDGSDWIVVASNAGSPNHPAWWLNLQSHSEATIQVMAEKMRVVGRKATPEEKEKMWPQFIRMHPNYTEYRKKTTREIPLVILHPQQH
jgi:deazaflavin-dependent oxidoreductase (nitroreductase family)